MEVWSNTSTEKFDAYIDSFKNLTQEQKRNFAIKKEHSYRVVDNIVFLANKLQLNPDEKNIAYLAGLFHDIGRFSQLIEYNTFLDSKSVDHAELAVKVLVENEFLDELELDKKDLVLLAIQLHNKFELPEDLTVKELLFARLLRDADKLDILKVLTEYYLDKKAVPNHALTWELPKGNMISPAVAEEILAEKLVSKRNVVSEIDVKIMQLSWVYDLNLRVSFDYLIKKRFLEKIYSTLPKNDLVIQIYRKVKVYAENKLLI